MTIAEELARLQQLRDSGSLTETEFEEAKRKAIHESGSQTNPYVNSLLGGSSVPGKVHGMDESTWCVLMHLSQLLIISGLGIIAPIVMWAISKDQSDVARIQGARMMNWLVSSLIYAAIAGVLSMFIIGIPILMLILVLDLVFPIIAAVKANNGEAWSYPLAMRLFDEN